MSFILPTLIGGLLALAGALIGPYFQRHHERWKAEREDRAILRQKAELLFDELDQIITASQAASLTAVAMMKDNTVQAKQVPDLGRVRAIAAIYFPTSLGLIQTFEDENFEFMKWVVKQAEEAVAAGEGGIANLQGLPMITTLEYQKRAAKLVTDMRTHLAENVPKLELETVK